MAYVYAVKLREAGLPLNNHCSGDQQHKKDRHQYRGRQPLTKVESGIWHMTAFYLGGSAALAAEEALDFGGIAQDQCLLHRLGALIPRRHLASLVQGADRAGVQILSQRRWFFLP